MTSPPAAKSGALTASVRIRSIVRQAFSPALLEELHALSHRLMREELGHFRMHAETNDVVHVFERVDTRAIVGFQFWKTIDLGLPCARAIVGGKLRVLPEYRRRGLHLRSGLRFYASAQLAHPRTRFYRLSLASIFGFTSIASALAEYHLFDPHQSSPEGRAIRAGFEQLARSSNYEIDLEQALFRVHIFMTPETLSLYPQAFFDKPAARVYAQANPDYRANGSYVGFWFRFTPRNVLALVRAIRRARGGTGGPRPAAL
jgi:hypothetical protein